MKENNETQPRSWAGKWSVALVIGAVLSATCSGCGESSAPTAPPDEARVEQDKKKLMEDAQNNPAIRDSLKK